jgi:N-acetylglucosamine kinase-like BadF-type ATPase
MPLALRAVMQAHDGRDPETLLSELVLKRYGLQTPPELIHMIYHAESPRSAVATLSDLVEQAAGWGDSVAIAILEESSRELARTIAAVYSKLGTSAVPLVITGGAILHGRHLKQAFHRACEAQRLTFTAVRYVKEPAEGALRLARILSLS